MTVKEIYDIIVAGKKYDYVRATKHNDDMMENKVLAKDLPGIEEEFLSCSNYGCCLHYAMALFKRLYEAGFICYIAICLEENPQTHSLSDMHCSVYYIEGYKKFIADPVETVKGGKDDYSHIPFDHYHEMHGTIWLYDPYGEHGDKPFFTDFLCFPQKTYN